MKKSRLLNFAVLIISIFFARSVFAADGDMGVPGGADGSTTYPYLIEDIADFNEFASDPNYWDDYISLEVDIDLAGRTYNTAVIASDTDYSISYSFDGVPFTGNFDGNGHIIINLTIDTNGIDKDYLGLFGLSAAGAVIANLGLEGVSLTGSGDWTYGDFTGDIGALVGNNSGTIQNCWVSGSVTGGVSSEDVGGLCGWNQSSGSITGCAVVGSVTCGSNSGGIGGLCGSNDGDITDCWASSSVTGKNSLGGLCGYLDGGNITNCYSTGDVNGTAGDLGGLCGERDGGTVTNCFWDRETSGMLTSNGGTGKTTVEMKTASTFTSVGWDFTGTWGIEETQTYPFLKQLSHVGGITNHVKRISMSTTYHYTTTNPVRYTFDADVDLRVSHSVKAITVERPDGQTYAMTLDNSDPSEPYYEFGVSSFDLADLTAFDSGLFTFTITYTDDSTETTSVLYANPNDGQPIAAVTQEPVLSYPADGQTNVPLKMGFRFDSCRDPNWTIGIECEPQDGSADVLEGSLAYDAWIWGVWNWGGESLLPNKTYDVEMTYDNAYWGTNADGIDFVVDKDAELDMTFTTTSDTSASVSDHVFFLEIRKGIDYNDPRWLISKRYDFHFEAQTDDTILFIEFVTPGSETFTITQAEELCVGDDWLDPYKVCTEYDVNSGLASWDWEMYALEETGTDTFGDGQYMVKFYYSATEYHQTTIDYTVPGTSDPLPQPTQKPNITSPGYVTLVPSSFTMNWDLCTDANVNNIDISLEDDFREIEYEFDLSPVITSTPLIASMHGIMDSDISFEHEYVVLGNSDRIPLVIGKYCSINHPFSVSRYSRIDFRDFAGFAAQWGRADCNDENNGCDGYDLDVYGQVDIRDLALLIETWLTGSVPD